MAKKKADEEFPEMVAVTTAIGKAARNIINIEDEIENDTKVLEEKLVVAKADFIKLMKDDGKESIVVDGKLFTVVHREAVDLVRIKDKKSKRAKKEDVEND